MIWVIVISELIAAYLIWWLWRGDDHMFFKISLSLLSIIPILGPVAALWIGTFPKKQRPAFQNLSNGPDVYDRWRNVFEERDTVKQREKFKKLAD